MSDNQQYFASGETGTTGREVFEDGTQFASGNAQQGTGGYQGELGGNQASGVGSGMGYDPATASSGTAEHHHRHHHEGHHHQQESAGGLGGHETSHIGEGYGSNQASSGQAATGAHDRVGDLGQNQSAYEMTGNQGPATTGAAGTDRFDTGNSAGPQESNAYPDLKEETTRTTGKAGPEGGSSLLNSVFTTTSEDFTGRKRTGGTTTSAYADTHGRFQGNSSGPGGNSALTGREGDLSKNPVAQAGGEGGVAAETGEKKGLMQKIKDAF